MTMEMESLLKEIAELKLRVAQLESSSGQKEQRVALICFSGDWDKLFAAFTIATGALALGQEVDIFFTFWAANVLRKKDGASPDKSLGQKLLARMLPPGVAGAPLSRLNCFGLSKLMLRKMMIQSGVEDIDFLIREAREMGARFHLCETSTGLFGLDCKEIIGGDEINKCGVATFLSIALKSRLVLFI